MLPGIAHPSFVHEGRRIRLESIQNAIDQATAAAESMAGDGVEYVPLPWFWSDQYDVKLQIAGLHAGYDKTLVTPGARERSQSVWYFRDDRMTAVDAINDPRSYMIGKRLLERGEVIEPRLLPMRLEASVPENKPDAL